jgi:hypothetical protein
MKKYEDLTAWFPASMNPARAGWYEANGFRIVDQLFLYWTGDTWEYYGANADKFPQFGSHERDQWRGLAAEYEYGTRVPLLDVTGERYGLLVAKKVAFANQQGAHWIFACDCGNKRVARLKDVRSGNTATCGCKQFTKSAVGVKRPWATKAAPVVLVV